MLDRVYTSSARFDGTQRFLSEDEIYKLAPSAFATTAHHSRSDRFTTIATMDAVRALDAQGFGVVGAKQSVARMEDRRDFTKHLLRLRSKSSGVKQVGDTVFEILLKNANDGTSRWDIMSGLFRVCCQNSLVAMCLQMETAAVRHSGDAIPKVIDATFRVLDDADRALSAPDQWSQLLLSPPEQMAFAESAHAVRFPVDVEGEQTTPIGPSQLLTPRRMEDRKADLWTVFNRVQENAIKGGLSARGETRRVTSRAVKGIDQGTALNRALWTLGEKMAALKA